MNVGFTYEIRDKSNPDLVYYGSSELPSLEDRMKIHVVGFNFWKNKNTGAKYCSSYKVIELNNFKATLLKIVFFTIKWELREQERHLIEYRVCVNERVPNRTIAEWYQDNKKKIKEYQAVNKEKIKEQKKEYQAENREKIKEQKKVYREANKEHIKEKKKEYRAENKEKIAEYYQDNKEKIKEKVKEYQTENKEKIKEYQTEYREANRDKILKKFNCPCGGKYTHSHKSHHLKTKQHQNWLCTLN